MASRTGACWSATASRSRPPNRRSNRTSWIRASPSWRTKHRKKNGRRPDYEARRRKEREFLREIPDAYDLRIEGEAQVDGHGAWVIAGARLKPGIMHGPGCQGAAEDTREALGRQV
jgi:hypothetical protein